MTSKRCVSANEGSIQSIINSEDIVGCAKPRHMHRRTISKTSDELLESLKISSPHTQGKHQIVTAQMIRSQLVKKGLTVLREETFEESTDSLSDDEMTIRNIIEQRKALSPITYKEPENTSKNNPKSKTDKHVEFERISFNTSTTALTSNEDSNIDRVLIALENCFLPGNEHKSTRKSILELMQKSLEPHYSLVLDEHKKLIGVFYLELSTGYFHRIIGNDDLPIVIPPRRVKEYLMYDYMKKIFITSTSSRFDAFIML
ncbi:hypothetical protein SteCoe_154 [Stentor coeruleus]|uniref:CKK domain-containing protein n=1 Tax=Stentor coeruleus TaxID=5963 RepID=A0A1R2D4T2_9CILI|nr:hypothetical protein SteCoe_154 [Stentor coeruleus]